MVNNSETKVIYKGDGKTKVFPYTFAAIDADTIKVAVYDETSGVESTLTNDYYVDITAKTVTYPGYAPGQAPAESQQPGVLQETQKLVIYRETPLDQRQDLGEKYPLPIIESIGDKLTLIVQELKETLGRTITIDISSNETTEQLKERIFTAEETASEMAKNASASEKAAKSSAENAGTSEKAAKSSAENAGTSEEAAKSSAENAGASEKAASTSKIKAKASEINAKTSETNAKAWAMSGDSPDGAFDADADGGKTMSSKTWAIKARSSAQSASDNAKESKENANNIATALQNMQAVQSNILSIQEQIKKLEEEANKCVSDARSIRDSISSSVVYKGSVDTYIALPTSNKVGDMYNVAHADSAHGIKAGDNVIWNGNDWDNTGGTIDTSTFAQIGSDALFGTVTATTFKGKADAAKVADSASSVPWSGVTGKPTSMTANGGRADTAKVADSAKICTGNSASASSVPWSGVTGKPGGIVKVAGWDGSTLSLTTAT